MITILSGVGMLLLTLAIFSLFSMKMPKGSLAMSGMANAAVATFLVEASHKYISGDLFGISFFRTQEALAAWLQRLRCRSAWVQIQFWRLRQVLY